METQLNGEKLLYDLKLVYESLNINWIILFIKILMNRLYFNLFIRDKSGIEYLLTVGRILYVKYEKLSYFFFSFRTCIINVELWIMVVIYLIY